jgi:hypothetical protein
VEGEVLNVVARHIESVDTADAVDAVDQADPADPADPAAAQRRAPLQLQRQQRMFR